MKYNLLFFLQFVLLKQSFTRNSTLADFIVKFVNNESNPPLVVLRNSCWSQDEEVKLARKISTAGHRLTKETNFKSEFEYHNVLFILDLSCPNIEEDVNEAIVKKFFRSPFRWLLLAQTEEKDEKVPPCIHNSPILADSEVVLAELVDDDEYILTELHKTTPHGRLLFNLRGYYNEGYIEDVRPNKEHYRRRRNVMGHPLTMANVIQDSNSTQYHLPLENRLEPQYDSIAKICWMEVKLAFNMLNATPRYMFAHRWGYKQDGRWSGMIDDLNTGRADLGTNCLVSDTERLDVVSYTDMSAPFRVRFVFRQPPLSYVSNIFSLPFTTSVWVAIVVCAILSTAMLFFESKWESTIENSPYQLDGSIGDALLLTMSAVSQQGCVLEPQKISGRIMVWVFFAALMALYAAYSANIVVLLQAPSSSIRTLKQLAASKITLAANDVDYNHFVFSLYKDPDRVTIHKRVDPDKGKGQFYDINDGVERIRQGLFAFHSIVEPVYRRIEKTFLETEKCDLQEVDFVNGFDPFIPVKKDSPYLELLRVAFKQIRESGLQSALVKRLQVPRPTCSNSGSAFSSVGLMDLGPVLLFMMYGICAAVGILVVEVLVHKMWG